MQGINYPLIYNASVSKRVKPHKAASLPNSTIVSQETLKFGVSPESVGFGLGASALTYGFFEFLKKSISKKN